MLPPPNELPETAPRLADGRYVLLARIGRGGMAGVYAAWDTRIEEWRAIKVLLPKHARDGGLRTRFEREGLTMKSLQHPNLVRVYGVGSGEKLPFLVMELINAGSLYRWTKTHGAMPPRMASEAMIQLCAGVAAVHAAGVVHRDIKPRNVLVNWDGVLKLTDFGIAQLGDSQETRTGLAMGTLGFMSPEQLHDSKSVDLRTDIYAIGATLWSQITGRKARDLFRLEDEPRLMEGVPDPLRPILQRCLAYERVDRYPSARALSNALSGALLELPEDPAASPPLPLNLGALSLKSKPDNTFSEILTTMGGELDSSASVGSASSASVSPTPPPPVARKPVERAPVSLPPRRAPTPLPAPPSRRPSPGPVEPLVGRSSTPVPSILDRMAEDDPGSLPAYMIGVEQPRDRRRPELITYRPDEPDAQAASSPLVWLRRIALVVVLGPIVSALALVATVLVVASFGAWQVRTAESELGRLQLALSEHVAQSEALPRELELLGADGEAIREEYRRWEQSPSEAERTEAALAFVQRAEGEARPRIRLSKRSHEEEVVHQRLERLMSSVEAVQQAEVAQDAAASTWPGRLSIFLRLAPAPR